MKPSLARPELHAGHLIAARHNTPAGRAARRKVSRALSASKRAEAGYTRDCVAVLRGIHRHVAAAVDDQLLGRESLHLDAPGGPKPTVPRDQVGRVLSPELKKQVAAHVRARVGPAFDKMAAVVDRNNATAYASLIGIQVASVPGLQAIQDHVRERNMQLLEDAGVDYVDQIRDVLADPENEYVRAEDLREQIAERGRVSESRAVLIALDQTLKTNATISQYRQQSAGLSQYVWSTSRDERVRGDPDGLYPKSDPSHFALEGLIFSWDDPPDADVDGEPCNPGEAIRCRCVAVPVVEELDVEDEEAEGEFGASQGRRPRSFTRLLVAAMGGHREGSERE